MHKIRLKIHPFLFSIFPVLFLFSHNVEQVSFSQIVLPIVLVLVFTGILYLIALYLIKDGDKAGLIVTMFLVLFFSYGHVLDKVQHLDIQYLDKAKHLIRLWPVVFTVGVYFIIRMKKHLHNLIRVVNFITLVLVLITVANIAFAKLARKPNLEDVANLTDKGSDPELRNIHGSFPPDIYYIILDAYASSSSLKDVYGFDNSDFVEYLTNKGFYVASDSCSNYATTFLSLASSLNMEYVNNIVEQLGVKTKDRSIFYQMIRDNKVCRLLKPMGYKVIHFSSGWAGTNYNSNADMRFNCGLIDEFLLVLIRSTALDYFITKYIVRYDARRRIQTMFSSLGAVSEMEGPKFVFAHFICPHPPYLFDENGQELPKVQLEFDGVMWRRKDLYIGQLKFVNKKCKILINRILANSKTPPIIVIQADHGSASLGRPASPLEITHANRERVRERLHIFNAYYLPGDGRNFLYDSISPVNTFRLIFNVYFGANHDIFEDKSYYSNYKRPYIITDATDIVNTGEHLSIE